MVERDEHADEQDAELADDLARAGIDGAGALVGSAAAMALGPELVPLGAGVGGVIEHVVRRVGVDWYQRVLSPRQKTRVQVTYAFARSRIDERLAEGQTPRDDGFFEADIRDRSDAEELLDGVLFHASNGPEERKTRYLGYFFASVAFRADIPAAYGQQLLSLAERLTYRQLVCMASFDTDEFRRQLEDDVDLEAQQEGQLPADLRAEIDELARLYLLGRMDPDDRRAGIASEWGFSYLGNIYDGVGPTELGRDLADLMELNRIPGEEQEVILPAMLNR